MIKIDIRIPKKWFDEVTDFIDPMLKDKPQMVLFPKVTDPSIGYLLIHGNKDGYLVYNGIGYTTEDILEAYLPFCEKNKIKKILFIACHGGIFSSCTKKGVTIESLHNSIDEIRTLLLWKQENGEELPYLAIRN